jgi:hypothetical protein
MVEGREAPIFRRKMVATIIILAVLVIVLGYLNYRNINVAKSLSNELTLAKTAVNSLTTRATTAENALTGKLAAEGKAVANVGSAVTKVV